MFNQWRHNYDRGLEYSEINPATLREILVGRRIVDIKNPYDDVPGLILDNGVTVYVVPNEGCGGCIAGRWWVDAVSKADSAITDVRWDEEDFDCESEEDCDTRVRIFVYTESDIQAKEILTLEGYEDNGFYGYGFELYLVSAETEAKNKEEDKWY